MARLEGITKDSIVRGILPNAIVTIVDAKWYGSDEAAAAQVDADQQAEDARKRKDTSIEVHEDGETVVNIDGRPNGGSTPVPPPPPVVQPPKRFYGAVKIDPTRLGRDAGRIAEEVLSHLIGLHGADCDVTLELEARIPDGVPDTVVRTVTENCRTLKFDSQEFERE